MADEESNGLLIDSSIWLEYFFDQSRADEVERFLSDGPVQRFAVSEFTVGSLGVILGENDRTDDFSLFVRRALIEHSVQRVVLRPSELLRVLEAINEYNFDFDDVYQYVAAHSRNLTVISFDDDFDVTDRERRTPLDVLGE